MPPLVCDLSFLNNLQFLQGIFVAAWTDTPMPQSQYSKPWTLVDGGSKAESPVSYINIFIQCHSFITPQPAQHGYFIFSSEAQAPSTFICWRRCCILRTATENNIGKYIANIWGETRECVRNVCIPTNRRDTYLHLMTSEYLFWCNN